MYCPNCGKELSHPDSSYCNWCGYRIGDHPGNGAGSDARIQMNKKSEGMVLILSILIPGLGHMYAGKVNRGIAILVASILLSVVAFYCLYGLVQTEVGAFVFVAGLLSLVSFCIWIYAVLDSYNAVKEYNTALVTTGNPPW